MFIRSWIGNTADGWLIGVFGEASVLLMSGLSLLKNIVMEAVRGW